MRSETPRNCLLCAAPLDGPFLDLGELPACNRFTRPPAPVETHRLAMSGCAACGLVQLAVSPFAERIVPRVPWIKYNEPDRHLDDVAEKIGTALAGDCRSALGLGPFEAPLLDRLAFRGVKIDAADLLARPDAATTPDRYPYLETIQARLNAGGFANLSEKYGLVSLRYVLEHSHDPLAALAAIKPLIAPGGMLLIEVPDCRKFLERLDYSFIWEEHVVYLTQETLTGLARRAGYEVATLLSYEGPLEDALVALLRPTIEPFALTPSASPQLFSRYREEFTPIRDAYRSRLAIEAAAGQKVAVFGVGHQAIMFVNALGLSPYVAMMVDDDPVKQGHAAPGTATEIVSSAAMLSDPSVSLCLLAVGPRAEPAVTQKCAPLLGRGGRVYSIFPGSATPTLLESRQ